MPVQVGEILDGLDVVKEAGFATGLRAAMWTSLCTDFTRCKSYVSKYGQQGLKCKRIRLSGLFFSDATKARACQAVPCHSARVD